MKNFVKIATRLEDGNVLRSWIDQSFIHQLSQNSATQAGNNAGTCEFINGDTIEIITFNETIDSLS
jgi:hypothetical protein